jgi:hypothetical protein
LTNPTSFNYTFSSPASPSSKPEPELFALDKLTSFQLPNNQVLARNSRTGKEMVLPQDALNALSFCTNFRTIEEHVETLMEGLDGDPARAAAIREVVQSVHDGGLTISASEICRELKPDASASRIPEKPVVVIITCDCPPALERLLNSILKNSDQASIDRCYVVDDSRSTEYAASNREHVNAANRQASMGVHYFGADEAREMVNKLVENLPQHEAEIRFLLDRELWKEQKSYGVARNYSHLLSVGKPVIVFDDDTVCEVCEPPRRQAGVEFTGEPPEVDFYTSNDEWQELRATQARDPVARHMQCLGLGLPAAVAQAGVQRLEQEALRHAPQKFAIQLRPDSHVIITECGSMGDPGTGSNHWIKMMPGESRDRLLNSDITLQQALETRIYWLGRKRSVFHHSANMSQVTGFDNRQFLPPYFPIIRGEDQIFGEITRFMYPTSVVLEYGWAVPHLPIPERHWKKGENTQPIGSKFPGGLTREVINKTSECLAEDVSLRLEFLASLLKDLAGSPDKVLLDRFLQERQRYRASELRGLQTRIDESSELPAEWQDFLKSAFQRVEASLFEEPRMDELTGSVHGYQGRDLAQFWRSAWRDFGQSLLAWQEIRAAARELLEAKSP